ncbi:hypothetical protein FC96_GL001897 [Secundilactobacillus kimchicus JCM 15530]|uniref:Uncharacterized protein n=2 Tax=Secundilactobacillus kimchicus TaxID=528209 RepID=A0A0R1HX77_9LACO|nr:hypothetical protein FC96_GL001897 [Secundilactobacillus kimchicus JCM 15530]
MNKMAYNEEVAEFLITVGSKNHYIEGENKGFTAPMFDQQDVWDTAGTLIESHVLNVHLNWVSDSIVDIIWDKPN